MTATNLIGYGRGRSELARKRRSHDDNRKRFASKLAPTKTAARDIAARSIAARRIDAREFTAREFAASWWSR